MAHREYTTEEIAAAMVKNFGLVSVAARQLGCTPQTIYTRMKEDEGLQQIVLQARESLVDEAELSLRSRISKGEGWAVALALKTIGKDRGYVERQEIKHDGGFELKMYGQDAPVNDV